MIQADVFEKALTLEASVNARNHIGGTAPAQVEAAIERAHARFRKLLRITVQVKWSIDMSRQVFCRKYQAEMEGLRLLHHSPVQRVEELFDSVSKQAWREWLNTKQR